MNSLLECLICKKTFENPVILPCSHTICKSHEIGSIDGVGKQISCPQCNKIHVIPENGFITNLIVEDLIKRKFDRLELGAEHTTAVESHEYLKDVIDEFKRLRDIPELEITEAIDKIRNKIDLHREKAKKKIDDDAMKLIRELDEYEARCKASLSENKPSVLSEIEELIKSLEKDHSKWKEELNSFEKNVKKLKTIHVNSINGYKQIRLECEKIKKSIFTDEFEKIEKKQKIFCREKTVPLLVLDMKMARFEEIESNKIDKYGVKWYMSALSKVSEDNGEEYLAVYLHAEHHFLRNRLQVDAKFEILNEQFHDKSISDVDSFEFLNDDDDGYGVPTFYKISDLKANSLLYNESEKSINLRVSIYDLRWIPVQPDDDDDES